MVSAGRDNPPQTTFAAASAQEDGAKGCASHLRPPEGAMSPWRALSPQRPGPQPGPQAATPEPPSSKAHSGSVFMLSPKSRVLACWSLNHSHS